MRIGPLDRVISIERRTDTRDEVGQPIPTWERIGTTRWAMKRPVGGTERFSADQFIAREQVEFTVRWAEDLASLSPLDRIVYPAVSEPTNAQIFELMAVHDLGRKEGLRIMTARRSET